MTPPDSVSNATRAADGPDPTDASRQTPPPAAPASLPPTAADSLVPFVVERLAVRGAYAELHTGLDTLFGNRPYGADVRSLLGEAAVGACLLASVLRFEGKLNFQFQGTETSPVKLLVAQVTQDLDVRAMAKATDGAEGSFDVLLKGGMLAFLSEGRQGQPGYQAVVDFAEAASLSDAIEGYFARSEQLPTRLVLVAGPDKLVGFLLQKLPGRVTAESGDDTPDDPQWEHASALASTLSPQELLAAGGATVLHRLFHEEDVRVLDARPVRLTCTCSHAGISQMLLALGEEEMLPVLAEQGKIDVTCEFCGKHYVYTDAEARQLFAAGRDTGEGAARH